VNHNFLFSPFCSDQFAGLHAIVIPGTLRDSLMILDGLLEIQSPSEGGPSVIITDQAAYSDQVLGRSATRPPVTKADQLFRRLSLENLPFGRELRVDVAPVAGARAGVGLLGEQRRARASAHRSTRPPVAGELLNGRDRSPAPGHPESPLHAAQNERFVFKGSTPSRRSPRWSLRAKTRAAAMKYAWPDKNGHIARGGEVPMVAVAQAIEFANRHGLLGRNPRGHERTPDRLRARIHRRAKTSPPQRNGATRR
jgi:hypothetical protein